MGWPNSLPRPCPMEEEYRKAEEKFMKEILDDFVPKIQPQTIRKINIRPKRETGKESI